MSSPASSCSACGAALAQVLGDPTRRVCTRCGRVVSTDPAPAAENDSPFGDLSAPAPSVAKYMRRRRAGRPWPVMTIAIVVVIQLIVLTGLGAAAWYWLHPHPATETNAALAKRGSETKVQHPSNKTPGRLKFEETTDHEPPITPIAPAPDDPAIPGILDRLKKADRASQLNLVRDLGQRGPAARRAVPVLLDMVRENAEPFTVPADGDPAQPKRPGSGIAREVEQAAGGPDIELAQEKRWRYELTTELLTALRLIGIEREQLPSLLQQLQGDNESRATTAAYALGIMGEPAVDSLLHLLQDQKPGIRLRVLRAFFYSPVLPPRVLQPVTDRLSDDDPIVRQSAPGVLLHLGPKAAPAVPALIKAVEARSVLAALALGAIGPDAQSAAPALRKALGDQDTVTDLIVNVDPVSINLGVTRPSLAAAAAMALEKIGPAAQSAVPELIAALHNKRPDARAQVTHALGQLATGDPQAAAALAKVVADEKEMLLIRAEAVEALGQLGSPAAAGLLEGLRSKQTEIRTACARNLGKIAPLSKEAVIALGYALADAKPTVRLSAAATLAEAGQPALAALDDLGHALAVTDQNPAVIQAVTHALASLGDRGGAVLIQALGHGSTAVRVHCAQALSTAPSLAPGAIAALSQALDDKEEEVRAAAATALGRLGGDARATLPVLQKHAQSDPSDTVRKAAVDAAARISSS